MLQSSGDLWPFSVQRGVHTLDLGWVWFSTIAFPDDGDIISASWHNNGTCSRWMYKIRGRLYILWGKKTSTLSRLGVSNAYLSITWDPTNCELCEALSRIYVQRQISLDHRMPSLGIVTLMFPCYLVQSWYYPSIQEVWFIYSILM